MLDKLFDHIELQLNEETNKYRKLEICKYIFETSKICILSLSVGLSFISIFAILSAVFAILSEEIYTAEIRGQPLVLDKLKPNQGWIRPKYWGEGGVTLATKSACTVAPRIYLKLLTAGLNLFWGVAIHDTSNSSLTDPCLNLKTTKLLYSSYNYCKFLP